MYIYTTTNNVADSTLFPIKLACTTLLGPSHSLSL